MQNVFRPSAWIVVVAAVASPFWSATAESFKVTYDFTDSNSYSDDMGAGAPAGAKWVAGSSDNTNVTPGNFFGRHWDTQVLIFDSGHGRVGDPDFPGGLLDTQIHGGDQDPPYPPAPYFSWTLDIDAGYELDDFSVSFDGDSSMGFSLYPFTSWMNTDPEPLIIPSFSDANFDFSATSSANLDYQGTLDTKFYTGGTVAYYFDTLTVTGNITAIPEPDTGGLLLFGTALALRRSRRR